LKYDNYTHLFQKPPSDKQLAGGPEGGQILLAQANGTYWTLIETAHFRNCKGDNGFINRTNAFKHALQVYGPTSNKELPDFRANGGVKDTWHGHVKSRDSTYVLEWTIIDKEKKILLIRGFDVHENYNYVKKELTENEKKDILAKPENLKQIQRTKDFANKAIKKVRKIIELHEKKTDQKTTLKSNLIR